MRIWHGYTVGINGTMCLKYFVRNNLENQIRKKLGEKKSQQMIKVRDKRRKNNSVSVWHYLIRRHKILLFSKILKSRLYMRVQKKTIIVISSTHVKHDYLPWGMNVHCKSFQKKYLNLGTTSKCSVRTIHNEHLRMVAAGHIVLLGQGIRGLSDKLGMWFGWVKGGMQKNFNGETFWETYT